MTYDEKRLQSDEESGDLLTDPTVAEVEDDDDDEKDPLMAAVDDEPEEKDWM